MLGLETRRNFFPQRLTYEVHVNSFRDYKCVVFVFDFLQELDDEAEAPKKRIKREVIVGPGIDKDVSHEAVGLKPATLVPKEIPIIKKKNSVLQVHFIVSLNDMT